MTKSLFWTTKLRYLRLVPKQTLTSTICSSHLTTSGQISSHTFNESSPVRTRFTYRKFNQNS
jgi:hypothetical protein